MVYCIKNFITYIAKLITIILKQHFLLNIPNNKQCRNEHKLPLLL